MDLLLLAFYEERLPDGMSSDQWKNTQYYLGRPQWNDSGFAFTQKLKRIHISNGEMTATDYIFTALKASHNDEKTYCYDLQHSEVLQAEMTVVFGEHFWPLIKRPKTFPANDTKKPNG